MIPKLNTAQIDRISEIIGNLGVVFLTTVVVPAFTKTIDFDVSLFLRGITLSIGCIIMSIAMLKGGKKWIR